MEVNRAEGRVNPTNRLDKFMVDDLVGVDDICTVFQREEAKREDTRADHWRQAEHLLGLAEHDFID